MNKVFSESILFILLASLLFVSCKKSDTTSIKDFDPIDYVDVFVGTGGHGHTFPGATRPNAMVQFSPDTHLLGWEASSGYHFPDTTIYAFSLTHLSGTGIGDMGDVALLPFSDELKGDTIPYAIMDKSIEKASAGFYSVRLKDQNIDVALSSTERVGIMKVKYAENKERAILLNLSHILQPNWGHKVTGNDFKVIDASHLEGTYYTSGWAYDHLISYYIEFSEKAENIELILNNKKVESIEGLSKEALKNLKVKLYFPKNNNELLVKTAISPVSSEGAKLNMQKELPDFDFEKVVADSKNIWRNLLSSIKIDTKDEETKKIFYTALYHSNIAPYNYQDVDGSFRAIDKKVYKGDVNDGHYTVFSIWDTYRTLHPLLTIIDPTKALNYGKSLVKGYEYGTIMPKWPLASNYTGTMPAYHSVSILADLVAKGLADKEDLTKWLDASVATSIYREDLAKKFAGTREIDLITKHVYYKDKYGFIPADSIPESVSWAVEMAYNDWCISVIADKVGNKKVAEEYKDKSELYRKYWDKEYKLMRPIMGDGKFRSPFNPRYSSHMESDYTEGNAYQWSFYAPHDMENFIALMGGKAQLEANLDTLFTTSSQIDGENQSGDITGLIGQYAHGNEPSHHIAYLYNYTDSPYKGQIYLDSIMSNFYKASPDGIIGNEDCGQMSAWYIMSSLGFYQIAPGSTTYHIGRPIVDKAEIRLPNGVFHIEVKNNSKENKKVKSAIIGGRDISKTLSFDHSEIKAGAVLMIEMTK